MILASFKGNIKGSSKEAGTAPHSGAHEVTPDFCRIRTAQLLVFSVHSVLLIIVV